MDFQQQMTGLPKHPQLFWLVIHNYMNHKSKQDQSSEEQLISFLQTRTTNDLKQLIINISNDNKQIWDNYMYLLTSSVTYVKNKHLEVVYHNIVNSSKNNITSLHLSQLFMNFMSLILDFNDLKIQYSEEEMGNCFYLIFTMIPSQLHNFVYLINQVNIIQILQCLSNMVLTDLLEKMLQKVSLQAVLFRLKTKLKSLQIQRLTDLFYQYSFQRVLKNAQMIELILSFSLAAYKQSLIFQPCFSLDKVFKPNQLQLVQNELQNKLSYNISMQDNFKQLSSHLFTKHKIYHLKLLNLIYQLYFNKEFIKTKFTLETDSFKIEQNTELFQQFISYDKLLFYLFQRILFYCSLINDTKSQNYLSLTSQQFQDVQENLILDGLIRNTDQLLGFKRQVEKCIKTVSKKVLIQLLNDHQIDLMMVDIDEIIPSSNHCIEALYNSIYESEDSISQFQLVQYLFVVYIIIGMKQREFINFNLRLTDNQVVVLASFFSNLSMKQVVQLQAENKQLSLEKFVDQAFSEHKLREFHHNILKSRGLLQSFEIKPSDVSEYLISKLLQQFDEYQGKAYVYLFLNIKNAKATKQMLMNLIYLDILFLSEYQEQSIREYCKRLPTQQNLSRQNHSYIAVTQRKAYSSQKYCRLTYQQIAERLVAGNEIPNIQCMK